MSDRECLRITRDGTRWLREASICRVLPVMPNRLYEWIQVGAVRVDRVRHNIVWVSVEDVLFLLCTPPSVTQKLGIRRIRPEVSAKHRLALAEQNSRSLDHAKNYREEWSTEDLELICAEDRPCDEELAKIVGRTISSIVTMRNKYIGSERKVYDREELEERIAEAFGRSRFSTSSKVDI